MQIHIKPRQFKNVRCLIDTNPRIFSTPLASTVAKNNRFVVQVIGAIPEGSSVMIEEVYQTSYMRGRENKNPVRPAPPASDIVKNYLNAVAARDLSKSASFLSKDF